MTSAIIGYTGFIGSYLRTQIFETCDLYNSKNIADIKDKHYDIVYITALPATKWLVNKNPIDDLNNILYLQDNLKQCTANTVVLISTIDIYSKDVMEQNEDDEEITKEPYGKHRYMMEQWTQTNFKNTYIIRLPGIFGFGLKKNIIFDLLNDNNVNQINPFSIFQWYYLEDLWEDIQHLLKTKNRLCNLFSEPIRVFDIISKCFPHIENSFPEYDAVDKLTVKYNYKSKYSMRSKKDILHKLKKFIYMHKQISNLVVSNLCWLQEDESHALSILKRYGINKLELAITRYMSWDAIIPLDSLHQLKDFEIYSFQSLFYAIPYNLFINPDQFVNHFKNVIRFAKKSNIKRLVFGSPLNRKKPNGFVDADDFFVNVMLKVVSNEDMGDVIICIEPNAKQYGCNFIVNIEEALTIINKINHPNVLLNYDTGNAIMMNDFYKPKKIGHIQISAPFLNQIKDYQIVLNRREHVRSLEMKSVPIKQFESNIKCFCLL